MIPLSPHHPPGGGLEVTGSTHDSAARRQIGNSEYMAPGNLRPPPPTHVTDAGGRRLLMTASDTCDECGQAVDAFGQCGCEWSKVEPPSGPELN